jgi:4-amino-4-deoxy-L-arabinose transferase-like glycosyltransferase
MKNKKFLTISILTIIIALAAFFRLWKLDDIPPGLYPDSAIYGNDAFDSLKNKDFKVFYPENNGREGLYMWLLALSFYVFKTSIWSLRFVGAIAGILTVLGTYLLGKKLFNEIFKNENKAEITSLLSSFFLAVSFWHTNFSRIGFRAILVPFFIVFILYFLFIGIKNKKLIHIIISGIFLGLGFYTYISYRFIVLALIPPLIFWFYIYKKQRLEKKYLFLIFVFLFIAFIIALPIGIYFLNNPSDFFGRAAGVSVFSQPNPLSSFIRSFLIHLQSFNFQGDFNWRHNFSGDPQLILPIGIFFIIGIIFCIKTFINYFKNKNYDEVEIYIILISWFFSMILPGALSYEGIPHALRIIGTIPVVYLFSGLGAYLLFEKIKENFFKTEYKFFLYISIFILLMGIVISEFDRYFYKWGQNKEVENAFSKNYVKIGQFLNSLPDDIEKYVIVNQNGVPVPFPNGIPMPAQTPIFIERTAFGKNRAHYILPNDLEKIKIKKDTVFIPLEYDKRLFSKLDYLFTIGNIKQKDGFSYYEIFLKDIISCPPQTVQTKK